MDVTLLCDEKNKVLIQMFSLAHRIKYFQTKNRRIMYAYHTIFDLPLTMTENRWLYH